MRQDVGDEDLIRSLTEQYPCLAHGGCDGQHPRHRDERGTHVEW